MWKIIAERTLLTAEPFLRVTRQHVVTDTGREVPDYFQVVLPDFAICVAVTEDNHVLTLWQYKHGAREYGLTFPAGIINPGEDAEAAMQRELLEETGYCAKHTMFLGRYATNGNQQCGFGHLFLMTGCRIVSEPAPGDLETIKVLLMQVEEVEAAVRAGAVKVLPHVTIWAVARSQSLISGVVTF